MQLPIYQVDAFTSLLFGGNPAAVCPLESWLPDETLQAIGLENNLSETAFFVREGDTFHIRWFTPTVEVDLCGHATLASAYVIINCLHSASGELRFKSKSGELIVRERDGLLALDFPSRPPQRCSSVHPRLIEALGTVPLDVQGADDYLVIYESAEQIRTLQPNFDLLSQVDRFAVIVTAPGGDGIDFVSRFFAPSKGINEDPVTGRAHCTLIPYWARRLGKSRLQARQISARGGELWCELRGDRVEIAGKAVLYLRGTINI
jgi:PhzF family phenazine biosynthesis protein